MSKFVSQIFGLVIFAYIAVFMLGITNGYMEQQAFVRARDEVIQRIREADPADIPPTTHVDNLHLNGLRGGLACSFTSTDSTLNSFITNMRTRFGAGTQVCIAIVEDVPDEEGMYNTVSYGDRVRIGITGHGSGRYGFRRNSSQVVGQPAQLQSGAPFYASVRDITIQNRSVKRTAP